MEGDFPGDALNIEEEGGGETNYSLAVNGVVGISCIDGFLQSSSGVLTNPQSRQEMLAPLSMRARVSTAFKVCDGSISWIGICIEGVVFT